MFRSVCLLRTTYAGLTATGTRVMRPVAAAVASKPAPIAAMEHQKRGLPSMGEANINPRLLEARYAVRGLLPQKAAEIEAAMKSGDQSSYPFQKVIYANIGNPQQVGQKPVTFFRQVLSLLEWDHLLEPATREAVLKLFPEDAVQRALAYQAAGCKLGAYTNSKGFDVVRNEVAGFIEKRDGFSADPNRIFLTAGASEGITTILGMIVHTEADQHKTAEQKVGVMIPTPQYPLYSATIALCGGEEVGYYLNEDKDWDCNVGELQRSLDKARAGGADVRTLCVINPGNPTGQCLSKDTVEDIIRFCERECLVLLADEVYQTNTYRLPSMPFHSFRKSVFEMKSKVELASFHSVSKGMLGECGRRGGFMELINFGEFFLEQLEKRSSMNLCSNTSGQLMVGLSCAPPVAGDASHELYQKEMNDQYESLKTRATRLADAFNAVDGMSCNQPMGAMYLFPQVKLTAKAKSTARKAKHRPDTYYCLKLLEKTGICVVPGSGFGQVPGTFHFRCTFLPLEEDFDYFVGAIVDFQREWAAEFGTE